MSTDPILNRSGAAGYAIVALLAFALGALVVWLSQSGEG